MSDEIITLFLTDDHQTIVEGVMALAAQDPCLRVVGYCNDGLEVLDKVRAIRPDVLVLDISLPGMNGFDACRLVKAEMPKTRILMLTMHSSEQCVIDAFERGASGYLIKEAVDEFCQAVHGILRGETYLGRGIPRSVLDRIDRRETGLTKAP
jgi:DNA-binding NarL/FixJ family response regulator